MRWELQGRSDDQSCLVAKREAESAQVLSVKDLSLTARGHRLGVYDCRGC